MILLDYQFSARWKRRSETFDFLHADKERLRLDAFEGDQIFKVNEADFSAAWDWVPLLDFAISLAIITDALSAGASDHHFEFTESEAEIRFKRHGNDVTIWTNYGPQSTLVRCEDLQDAVQTYCQRFLGELLQAYPLLSKNPHSHELFSAAL